ncbi:MAG: ATP-binding protein [Proteobacteria bacterium]|nr:ATP-binding protein [Pseudomonadota bacterium]
MYIQRLITERLYRLAESFPVIVISGARQVGKSTLLQNALPRETDYVVFDPVVDIENARRDPELFLDNHLSRPLLLDEIQYAPELAAALKRRIDKDRSPGQFILTGSQQWQVMKSLAESLAGRAAFLDLEGFCLVEIANQAHHGGWLEVWLDDPEGLVKSNPRVYDLDRTLYEMLWRGWLPDAVLLPLESIPDFHEAYFRTYVERDVRLLGDISDWQSFGRFVRLVAALTAQELNYSQLGRDIGITPQTSKRWLDMLRATFQWFDVPAFSGNTVKRVSSKPKGYIADTGFACASQLISSPRALGGHPMLGALFETAVAGEIRKLCTVMSPRPRIYHWRSRGGAEVDLILERDGRLFPIEIKVKSRPSRGDTRGITAFRKTYSHLDVAPGLVIAPTEQLLKISDNDFTMPWNISAAPQ